MENVSLMSKLFSIIIYMFTFGISLFACKLYQNYCIKKDDLMKCYKRFIWILLIIAGPVFISAIRYDVGTDYLNYVTLFKDINSLPLNFIIKRYGNEPLYLIINKIAYILFKKPWGVFFLSSLIIHTFTMLGIDFFKEHLSMPMALFIYYMYHFNYGLNGIRQMIAISIVFYSLKYIYQRRPLKYIIFIIVATMFHNTAIICVMFYLIASKGYNVSYNKNIKKLIFYTIILLSPILVSLGLKTLIRFPIFAQYEHYIIEGASFGIGLLIDILPIIIPVFFYRKQITRKDQLLEPFIDLMLLNIPFQLAGYLVNWGGRLSLYTNIFYYLLPPILIHSLYKRNNKRILNMYYVVYFLLHYFVKFIINNYAEAYPYNTIF